MTKRKPGRSGPPRSPGEHAPHCPEPAMMWQQPITPGLARIARCRNCGAVEIDRTEQATKFNYDESEVTL